MSYGLTEGDLDRNRELNQLAKAAQQYPDRSYERRRILDKLANKVMQSKKLVHPRNDSLPPAVYEDIYREALNITLMEICKNIEKYDSTKDLLGWFNFVLNKRFIDCCRGWTPLDRIDLKRLDNFPKEESNLQSEALKQLIEEDPDKIFTKKHIKSNPNATFQHLVLARIWEDRKWEEISSELNVPKATLCEFFKKQLKELTPYFREYLVN
jgi:DNA-directed RNA polymerase specialized sigma24 family protein